MIDPRSVRDIDLDLERPSRANVFLTICLFSFLVNGVRVAFAPLVDVFIEMGISPSLAGLAATAVWVGSALSRLPTGYLLIYVSRQRAILSMGIFLSVTSAFTAVSPDIRYTIVGAFLVGLATGVFYIAANPLVSELFPEHVGLAVGLRGMFSQLAAVSIPFLVSVAIILGTWRLVFGAIAVGAGILTIAFRLAVARADMPDAGAGDRDFLGAIRRQRRLIAVGIVFVGFAGFVWQGVFNFYVTYLGVEKNIPSGTATTLLTVLFAAGVPSFVVAGRLADRFSYLPVLFATLVGFVATLLALTVVEGVLAIAAVSIAMGLIVHCLFPVADAYLLDTLPDENRASAYSGFSATMMLMQAPGSVAVGLLADAGLGYTLVFQGYAVFVACIVVVMAVLAHADRLPRGNVA